MPEFVTVEHPDLPGQTARMVNPRNGWKPAKKTTATKAAKDSPAAGPSTTKEKE